MISPRPTTAFVLSLCGGILIIVGALFFLLLSPFFFSIFSLLAIVFGIIVTVGAVAIYRVPSQHLAWGVIILIFSVLSIIGFGGFIAGLVLGVVGGSLGISWRPYPEQAGYAPGYTGGPYGMPVMPWRLCMGCGRWLPWAYNVCPLCGTQVPIAPWVPRAPDPIPAPATGATGDAPAAPTAPWAPPAQETIKAPCPTCEGQAEWNAVQKRWFCPAESKYF